MITKAFYQELSKTYRPYTSKIGMYSSVAPIPSSVSTLLKWQKELNIRGARQAPQDELHCTVMWSKVVPNCEGIDVDPDMDYVAKLDHFEYWDGHDKDGYLVAVLTSPGLSHRHTQWKLRGAVSSFPDYVSHVTLADKFRPTPDLFKRIVQLSDKYRGCALSFSNETLEDLNL